MIQLFLSYGGTADREFCRKLENAINSKFNGILNTRIIEDHTPYDGKTWRDKVLSDLEGSSLFIILLTKDSISRPWPNQELGYAWALLRRNIIKKIIPVVEIESWDGDIPIYIKLKGFVPSDMDKINFEYKKTEECISEILIKLSLIDLKAIEREKNPILSQFNSTELELIKVIIEKVWESENEYHHFCKDNFTIELPNLTDEIFYDTLDTMINKGYAEEEGGYYFIVSSFGLFSFLPYFKDINTDEAVNKTYMAIVSRYKIGKPATGQEIKEFTTLPPILINVSIEMLKMKKLIKVDEHAGTAPFNFGTAELSPDGKKVARDNELI